EGIKPENHYRIVETIGDRIRRQPFAHWAALFESHDVPHARSQWTEDLLDDPQVAAEGLALQFDDPTVGPMTQVASHVTVTGIEWQQPSPAPLAGQHTDELLQDLGLDAAAIAQLRASGAVA
ncbi:MAG: CoA transferase, partial [Dehalococcoidia bacterium]